MAVTTLKAHVSRALDFYNKPSIFFSIGKTTPWSDPNDPEITETSPPLPKNTDELVEVLGYKIVETKFLVVEDKENGKIVYKNTKWRIVKPEDALTEGARWVYISSYLSYMDFNTDISYRQIGVLTGLKRSSKVLEGKGNLLPHEVEETGILEVIDNRTPVYREVDQRERLSLIIEF